MQAWVVDAINLFISCDSTGEFGDTHTSSYLKCKSNKK